MQILLWHHEVRAQITKERLYFWRFSVQTFETATVVIGVDKFLQEYRQPCRSYAIYGTFGNWDVLVRCWLPPTVSPEVFEVDLLNALASLGAENPQYFSVHEVLRHNAWRDGDIPEPTGDDLFAAGIEVDGIDRYNGSVTSELLIRLAGGDGMGNDSLSEGGRGEPNFNIDAHAISRGLVAPLDLTRKGIRFQISYSHPRSALNHVQRDDINRRLLRVCGAAVVEGKRRYDESPRLAVYSGYGTWTTHLITAQAPDGHFYSFSRALLEALYRDGIAQTYPGMKPTTTVYASRQPALIRESLIARPIRKFTEADLEGTLAEDETLELKASVWLDTREFYETGRHSSFQGGLEAVAKAVCGMLNREGGVVVIGLGEVARLPRDRSELGSVKRLGEISVPVTPDGQIAVLGLEEEYRNKSSQGATDWDSWMRAIRQGIANRVSPDPVGLFSVHLEELRLSSSYGSRSLGLIVVNPPPQRSTWFYCDDQFFVRYQGSTVPLRGASMDDYRKALLRRVGDG